MRILHVTPFLWSGAGNALTRLCEAQARENEVGIITSGRSKGFADWPEYRRRLRTAGIHHFAIDFFDRDPAVFWPGVEAFAKLTRTWRPDLIHCHSGVPACAASLSGSRFIAQLHSWDAGRPAWMNTMDLDGFRHAERVLCGSIAFQKILIKGGVAPSRIRYLPWGLDLRKIRTRNKVRDSRSHNNVSASFRIGFLGRIEPSEGQLDLAKAFHKFHRRYAESRLELIGPAGDKEYRDEISLFVRKNGLEQSVKLRGRVADPYSKLRSWNLFTSLSSDQGQGIAVLEAMALGVPVLGRRVAGIEDYLHDRRTGIALNSSCSVEAAGRMEWALHHENELGRIAARAKQMVERDYNWDSTLEKMSRLYQAFTLEKIHG